MTPTVRIKRADLDRLAGELHNIMVVVCEGAFPNRPHKHPADRIEAVIRQLKAMADRD